jgi:hypothetical protein
MFRVSQTPGILLAGLILGPAIAGAADSGPQFGLSGSSGSLQIQPGRDSIPVSGSGYSLGAQEAKSSLEATKKVHWLEHAALTAVQQAASGNPRSAGLGAARSVLGAGIGSLKEDAPGWLKRTEVEFDFTESSKPEFSLLTVQPLFQAEDYLNTLFTQGRVAYGRDGRRTLNLGIGYRRLVSDEALMLGINTFFDYEAPFSHRRVGVGGEIRSGPLELNVNYYEALSGKRNANKGALERALDGYDLEVGAQIPYLPWARLFGKYFY